MNFTLMIIDMQKEFYTGTTKTLMDSASEYINAVLGTFRNTGSQIIWVQDKEADICVPGMKGFEIIDNLKPMRGEPIVHKEYGNSFNKTDCLKMINRNNTDILVLTGYAAEYCVLSTYRGALDLDLTPVILKNGIASDKEANIGFVENISNLISYGILNKIMLEDRKKEPSGEEG